MTQESDPAALLAEWTRVHESATKGAWREESTDDDTTVEGEHFTIAASCCATDALAIAHYHNTYGALLEVARGLVDWQADLARRGAPGGNDMMLHAIHAAVTNTLEPLARLAAGGGA